MGRRARLEIAVTPVCVTQHNIGSVVGWGERFFLDWLRVHPEVPRTRCGKTVTVRLDRLLRRLDELAETGEAVAPPANDATDDGEPTTPEGFLEALGRERAR